MPRILLRVEVIEHHSVQGLILLVLGNVNCSQAFLLNGSGLTKPPCLAMAVRSHSVPNSTPTAPAVSVLASP